MKRGLTVFLKFVVIFLGLAVLALFVFGIPAFIRAGGGNKEFIPLWVLIYLTAIPFYLALYQAMKILSYISKNTAFSIASVKALGYIKYCAIAMTVLYVLCMPFIIKAAEMDDAPGAVVLWMIFSAAPLVIAVFAALLQKMLNNVIDIKSENDLTV